MPSDAESAQLFLEHLRRLTDEAKTDTPAELILTILETSVREDEVAIIYKQGASSQVFGRRGSLQQLASLFSPEPGVDSLARIVLRSMVEPHADRKSASRSGDDDTSPERITWFAL